MHVSYRVAACRGRRAICGLAVALALHSAPTVLAGQQPSVGSTPPLPAYRPPALALVQPENGASVPQDRPIVVFRFAPGDSTDPVDARSFAVSVDGADRSGLFQIARDVASGPLAPDPNEHQVAIAVGIHSVAARICSIRGACAEIASNVMVAASATAAPGQAAPDRKRTLLDLLLAAAKKLLSS